MHVKRYALDDVTAVSVEFQSFTEFAQTAVASIGLLIGPFQHAVPLQSQFAHAVQHPTPLNHMINTASSVISRPMR
jgi:hypothetical protein